MCENKVQKWCLFQERVMKDVVFGWLQLLRNMKVNKVDTFPIERVGHYKFIYKDKN